MRKQGAGDGYSGVKGLNALLATVSTGSSAPVIVASRLRKGSANSARGAARLVADALRTTAACGVTGTVVLRADSAYYGWDVIAAARRQKARFSITARKDRAITAAIAGIPDTGWTPIRYPRAIFDEQLQYWVSDAEVAEIPYTAFTSKPKAQQVTARLIVRRVRDQNPDHTVADAQGELFPAWRHHAVFTDTDLPMLTAEADHRRHAIVEQVIADLKNGPLAHLPSGNFAADSAWLVLTAMAFNLTRAVGALARHSTPKPPPRRSAPTSSQSPPGSPDPPAAPVCDYPRLAMGRGVAAAAQRPPRTANRCLNPPTQLRSPTGTQGTPTIGVTIMPSR